MRLFFCFFKIHLTATQGTYKPVTLGCLLYDSNDKVVVLGKTIKKGTWYRETRSKLFYNKNNKGSVAMHRIDLIKHRNKAFLDAAAQLNAWLNTHQLTERPYDVWNQLSKLFGGLSVHLKMAEKVFYPQL